MSLKQEFDNAYSMLCDKLYTSGAVSYKDKIQGGNEAEEILDELMDMKTHADNKMKYLVRTIYKKLKVEYER